MWGTFLAAALTRHLGRRVAAFALVALTITLFILNIRRTAERAGRAVERLDTLERNDDIYRQMLDATVRRPRGRDDLVDRLRKGKF